MPEINEIEQSLTRMSKRLNELAESVHLADKQVKAKEIDAKIACPDFWNNQDSAKTTVAELKAIKALLDPFEKAFKDLQNARELFDLGVEEEDQETQEEAAVEVEKLTIHLQKLETMALLNGPHDQEDAYFSIQTGAGGSDACEWTEMLLRMYCRFFENQGWKTEELDLQVGDEAGIKHVELRVSGNTVYGYLHNEMGVHRLVRISPFSGKRETSFAAIDVVPEFRDAPEIQIDDKDLRIDTYRSGGKGGQHVNKTDSAVRITHLPTNIVVAVQNERSQHQNRETAMKILKARLLRKRESEREAEVNAHNATKMDNAFGSQIRSYVMHPYQLVKDLRSGEETGDIQAVMDGEIERFIDAQLRHNLKNRD